MRQRVAMLFLGFVLGVLSTYIVLYSARALVRRPAEVRPADIGPRSISPPIPDHQELIPPLANIKPSELRESFDEIHKGHPHKAIDIMAPRGTPVRAVVDGTIEKLWISKAGGNSIYEFDLPRVFCYYYAHLDAYAAGLHDGMPVKQGDVVGYVGSTGNASPDAPHLHFAINKLGPDKRWSRGSPVDPYPSLLEALKNAPPAQ